MSLVESNKRKPSLSPLVDKEITRKKGKTQDQDLPPSNGYNHLGKGKKSSSQLPANASHPAKGNSSLPAVIPKNTSNHRGSNKSSTQSQPPANTKTSQSAKTSTQPSSKQNSQLPSNSKIQPPENSKEDDPNKIPDIISDKGVISESEDEEEIQEDPTITLLNDSQIEDMVTTQNPKLFLTCTDGTKISKKNPLKVKKSIERLHGPVYDLQYLNSGNMFVICNDKNQMKNLLKSNLISLNNVTIPIKFSIALNHQTIKAKFYAENLKHADLAEILDELKNQNVIKVEKLLKDPNKSHVPLFLITFFGSTLPDKINIGGCKYQIDKFTPNPFTCKNCCRWGHTKGTCRSSLVCAKCAEENGSKNGFFSAFIIQHFYHSVIIHQVLQLTDSLINI